jgi:hypothetical protein
VQHISAGFAIATIALRLDRKSLESTDIYLEAGTELRRYVLDRIGAPKTRNPARPPAAAPLALVETFQPVRNMLRRQARSLANGAHIRSTAT